MNSGAAAQRSLPRLHLHGCRQRHRWPLSCRHVRKDTVEWARNTSKRNEVDGVAKLAGWRNVLVAMQDVVQVVAGLQRLEARESVGPEGGAHAVDGFVRLHVVGVAAADRPGSIAAAVSRAQATLSSSWDGSVQLAIALTLKAASQ